MLLGAVVAIAVLGLFSRYLGGAAGAIGLPLATYLAFPGMGLVMLLLLAAGGLVAGFLLSMAVSGMLGGGGGFGGGGGGFGGFLGEFLGGFFGGGGGGGSSGGTTAFPAAGAVLMVAARRMIFNLQIMFLLISYLHLRNAMARQDPAWRFEFGKQA